MEDIVSLDSEFEDPILKVVDSSLHNMGISATFFGEGLLYGLVRHNIPEEVRKTYVCPSTSICSEQKISTCEWIDEYLRPYLPEEYEINCSMGHVLDSIIIYVPGNYPIAWNFSLLHIQKEFKYESLPILSRMSYHKGESKISTTLLDCLKGIPVLTSKQTAEVLYLYSSVFNFKNNPLSSIDKNLREVPKNRSGATSKPILKKPQSWEDYVLSFAPGTINPIDHNLYTTNPIVYHDLQMAEPEENQDNGTW